MLIARTGRNEGQVYNAVGTNLTEAPDGGGNRHVGSYYLDLSGLAGTAELYSAEFSWVVANGLAATPEDDADGVDLDTFDDDELGLDDEDDTGAISVDRRVVTSVSFDIELSFPTTDDVFVHDTIAGDDGATNGVIDPIGDSRTLTEWLDEQDVEFEEVDNEVDVHWQYRDYLRWSIHWALYKVKCYSNATEELSDDVDQAEVGEGGTDPDINLSDGIGNEPYPLYGPFGLMTAHGAPGTNLISPNNVREYLEVPWVRLWDEDTIPGGYVARGDLVLPYAERAIPPGLGAPTVPYDSDVSMEEGVSIDAAGFEADGPSVRARGRWLRLRRALRGLNLRIGPDELLVLHVQTGRARLTAPDRPSLGDPGVVIAGSDEPSFGPKVVLHRHELRARTRRG